jgi:hypothetical protein
MQINYSVGLSVNYKPIQSEEGSLHLQTGPKVDEETIELLQYLEHSLMWCCNLVTSDSRSKTFGKF